MRYWYRFSHACCPVCGGNESVTKWRVTKKPKQAHTYEDDYDYCDV